MQAMKSRKSVWNKPKPRALTNTRKNVNRFSTHKNQVLNLLNEYFDKKEHIKQNDSKNAIKAFKSEIKVPRSSKVIRRGVNTSTMNHKPHLILEKHKQIQEIENQRTNTFKRIESTKQNFNGLYEVYLNNAHQANEVSKMPVKSKSEAVFKQSQEMRSNLLGEIHKIKQIRQKFKAINKRYMLEKIHQFLIFFIESGMGKEDLYYFPKKPFDHPASRVFINASKFGDNDRLKELMIANNKYLIYQYDHFNFTALHWASRRNHVKTVEFLLHHHSYVNATDIWGRTPLYYAIENGNQHIVYKLLEYNSSPWSTKGCDYVEVAQNNIDVIYYIKKFRMRDLISRFLPKAERQGFRQNYLQKFIKKPAI